MDCELKGRSYLSACWTQPYPEVEFFFVSFGGDIITCWSLGLGTRLAVSCKSQTIMSQKRYNCMHECMLDPLGCTGRRKVVLMCGGPYGVVEYCTHLEIQENIIHPVSLHVLKWEVVSTATQVIHLIG